MMEDTPTSKSVGPERRIFCNRTLNLRSLKAIGYDMDYTLVHYQVEHWEQRAYEHLRGKLDGRGWPVADLRFDSTLVMVGLVIDTELGNVVKADRFGYVKQAYHGTQPLDYETRRQVYAQTRVDLSDSRWSFLNTLFSLSEGCLYLQLVDRLDLRQLPEVLGYDQLYRTVRTSLDETHMEGELKADILADPDRYVDVDPDTALALLDQRQAGKKLLLITNSEWPYTQRIMSYAFDRLLPGEMTWRDLFDLVIVSARKPGFFTERHPLFEVATEEGLLEPFPRQVRQGRAYFGGNAALVEAQLGVAGEEILYVGDHIYGDVHISKSTLRWRTALILRDLETEVAATAAFEPRQRELSMLMKQKEDLEFARANLRLQLQRRQKSYGPRVAASAGSLERELETLGQRLAELDTQIAPMAKASSELGNPRWGLLLRTGNDKSRLARQVERYADIYTSRVSNFLHHSPFLYLRAPRGSLPHDPVGG